MIVEVMKALKRRIDNVITHLHDLVHLLLMHTVVTKDVRSRFLKRLWENHIQEASSLSSGTALAGLGAYLSALPQLMGDLVAATVLGMGGDAVVQFRQSEGRGGAAPLGQEALHYVPAHASPGGERGTNSLVGVGEET